MLKVQTSFQDDQKNSPLRILAFGDHGLGKTYTGINCFTDSILVDIEDGSLQYSDILEKNKHARVRTDKFHEVVGFVESLNKDRHQYSTVMVDSLSMIWDQILAECRKSILGSEGKCEYGKEYIEAGLHFKHFVNELIQTKSNLWLIAHEKKTINDRLEVFVADTWKKTAYLLDIVVRFLPNERVQVEKSRLKCLPQKNMKRSEFEAIIKENGIGIPEYDFVSEERVQEFNELNKENKYEERHMRKIFAKLGCSCVEQLTNKEMDKLILTFND